MKRVMSICFRLLHLSVVVITACFVGVVQVTVVGNITCSLWMK